MSIRFSRMTGPQWVWEAVNISSARLMPYFFSTSVGDIDRDVAGNADEVGRHQHETFSGRVFETDRLRVEVVQLPLGRLGPRRVTRHPHRLLGRDDLRRHPGLECRIGRVNLQGGLRTSAMQPRSDAASLPAPLPFRLEQFPHGLEQDFFGTRTRQRYGRLVAAFQIARRGRECIPVHHRRKRRR